MNKVASSLALALGAPLLLAAGKAQSQASVVAAPTSVQRCLSRGESLHETPTYPPQALEAKASGRVTVNLQFSGPDAAPHLIDSQATSVDGDAYASMFDDSVRAFIKAYRVPCLKPKEEFLLKQEYVFVPQDRRGVTMMVTEEERSARARRERACVRVPGKEEAPDYPRDDLYAEHQGTVIVRAEFVDADSAPRVTVLDDGGSRGFGKNVREFVLKTRNPCHDQSGPVEVLLLYRFRIEGASRKVLADLPLPMLLRSIKGIRSASVHFDFNAMACPFDVTFRPMQPYAPNDVGEVGQPVPERRFFLEWLKQQQLDLSPRDLNALIGQLAFINVPCTVLNLGKTSGGGASQ